MGLPGMHGRSPGCRREITFGSFYFPFFRRSVTMKSEFEKEVDSKFNKPSNPYKTIRPIRSSFDEEDV